MPVVPAVLVMSSRSKHLLKLSNEMHELIADMLEEPCVGRGGAIKSFGKLSGCFIWNH